MIQLYIPKSMVRFNSEYSIVDEEGTLVYRHKTNLFRTKRTLVNANNEIVMSSNSKDVFNVNHEISDRYGSLGLVKYKLGLFRSPEIIVTNSQYRIERKRFLDFAIYYYDALVGKITPIRHKSYCYQIEVDENKKEFLLMLMLTIIVIDDTDIG